MYYLIYQTTNLINNKIYIGAHQTEDLDDGYMGSGVALKHAIKKYGTENFLWDIIKYCKDNEEMYAEETRIVNEDFLKRKDTYNMTCGGIGSFEHMKGKAVVKDQYGNISSVSINDQKYLSGELVGINKDIKSSKQTLKKISKALSGQKRSKEQIENYRLAALNRPKIECPHCGKIGTVNNMKVYHMDKCRYNYTCLH